MAYGTIPIASTQQAGQGDAVILGGRNTPIAQTLLNIANNNNRVKVAKQVEQQKQTTQAQKDFFLTMAGSKGGWDADYGLLSDKAKGIITYLKDNPDSFNIAKNPQGYATLMGMQEDLKLAKNLSDSSQKQYNDFRAKVLADNGKNYDVDKSLVGAELYRTMTQEERMPYSLEPVLKPYEAQNELNKTYTPDILKQIMPLVNTPATTTEEQKTKQDNINNWITAYKPTLESALKGTGRLKDEDIPLEVDKYLETLKANVSYNNNKDQDQAEKQREFDAKMKVAWFNANTSRQNADTQKRNSLKEPTPTNTNNFIGGIVTGKGTNESLAGKPSNIQVGLDYKGQPIFGQFGKNMKVVTNKDGSKDIIVDVNKWDNTEQKMVTVGNYKYKATDTKGKAIQGGALYNTLNNYALTNNITYGGAELKQGTNTYNVEQEVLEGDPTNSNQTSAPASKKVDYSKFLKK